MRTSTFLATFLAALASAGVVSAEPSPATLFQQPTLSQTSIVFAYPRPEVKRPDYPVYTRSNGLDKQEGE